MTNGKIFGVKIGRKVLNFNRCIRWNGIVRLKKTVRSLIMTVVKQKLKKKES